MVPTDEAVEQELERRVGGQDGLQVIRIELEKSAPLSGRDGNLFDDARERVCVPSNVLINSTPYIGPAI